MYVNMGLIGYPLGHTFSPVLHTHFLDITGINGGYTCYEAESPSSIHYLLDMFKRYSFAGVNVTVPYKIEIMKYCDALDASAEKTGAVNTLHFVNGKITGYNTDVYGFGRMLETAGISTAGKNILLLGAGGAAKAIIAYLAEFKPDKLTIANRTEAKAGFLASLCSFKAVSSDMDSVRGEIYDIIINSTSIGLQGEGFPAVGAASEVLVDLQYKPAVTPFLAGYGSGPERINGFSMLVWQACRSFAIWTGTEPEPDIKKLSDIAYHS